MPPVTTGPNALEFPKIAAVLTEIVSQASGKKPITPITNTDQFISVAQTALLNGYDPLLNSISQVLSKTIFSIRPYYAKLRGLYADTVRYGNHVRKLQMIDGTIQDDQRLDVCKNNGNIDMYKGECPQVLQTNFYGQERYSLSLTMFRDQLNTAFSGPAEFGQFVTMTMTNISDRREQIKDTTARAAISNFIAGLLAVNDNNRVFHALSEYNTETGLSLTAKSVRLPENFSDFVRWLYAKINQISDTLTERSYLYHTNITGKAVQRHTPKTRQKVYMLADFINLVDALVRTVNYDNSFMRLTDFEKIVYWQSISSPDEIQTTPIYMDTDGSLKTADTPVSQDNVIGIIFDEEAIGYTEIDQWSAPTPFNPTGGFSVMWWNFTERYWNDFTENGVVIVLD